MNGLNCHKGCLLLMCCVSPRHENESRTQKVASSLRFSHVGTPDLDRTGTPVPCRAETRRLSRIVRCFRPSKLSGSQQKPFGISTWCARPQSPIAGGLGVRCPVDPTPARSAQRFGTRTSAAEQRGQDKKLTSIRCACTVRVRREEGVPPPPPPRGHKPAQHATRIPARRG